MLKGHIGLDSAIFPENTPGMAIDAFARAALWQAGLDYLHGTGHGVGAALNVHEVRRLSYSKLLLSYFKLLNVQGPHSISTVTSKLLLSYF